MSDQKVSKEKFQELQKEYNFLTTVKRQEIAENLEYAKSLGDLSENAEYHDARAYQAEVESRIKTLEYLLKNAVVVERSHTGNVEVGSTVTLLRKGTHEEKTFVIVGAEESDIMKGYISYSSPMGAALLGHTEGEEVTISVPAGTVEYIITSVT
jgi:transcription elongation factor GreA